jgi:hypothetical protein
LLSCLESVSGERSRRESLVQITGSRANHPIVPGYSSALNQSCDTQSAPNFTHVCNPDTDANIFDSPDPDAADFIGHHPGSAFLEMQFYPPGGLNTCSDPAQWCVAMVIFSFNSRDVFTTFNNADCLSRVGVEPANLAFLTTNGISQFVADPLSNNPNPLFNTVPGQQFKMNPGDKVRVSIHDTADGLKTEVQDLTLALPGP